MKKPEIKTFKKNLGDMRIALRKYCHHSSCRSINSCPREHKRCKEKLDLDTAMAWKIAEKLLYLEDEINYFEEFKAASEDLPKAVESLGEDVRKSYKSIKKSVYRSIVDLMDDLTLLRRTLSFHANKYPTLYSSFMGLDYLLYENKNKFK